jgi:dTDP-4-dehydrorhamnose 3,5-epimerase
MQFTNTPIEGLVIIEPSVFEDSRGYFFESYTKTKFADAGITEEFVQDNQSFSYQGSLRGLHFQKPPHTQSKLVRVISGEVYDVAVDLRSNSPTFGQWFGLYLSGENKKMFYIPQGFAHGFCVTSETAIFCYKCGDFFSQADESGIRFDDPELGINWPIEKNKLQLSEKDLALPSMSQFRKDVISW